MPPPGTDQPLVVGLLADPPTQEPAPLVEEMGSLSQELAGLFAERLGVEIRPVAVPDHRTLHDLLGAGRLHFAVTDEPQFGSATPVEPQHAVRIEFSGQRHYALVFPAAAAGLRRQAADFIAAWRADGTLRRLDDRYFGHIGRLDSDDFAAFLGHVRSRLPKYRKDFLDAQAITGLDWRLLAAVAYQESKWDPLATSPTGVRGMMMLTEETADRMGVTNRLDARQSILAGAEYLTLLMEELPAEIQAPDRLWFALAAYNLGMGHLRGARSFAPGLKRDPNSWVDMREVLPLMARPEYYARLKSGRARGGEAVILVENIRNYHDILARLEPVHTPPSLGAATKAAAR
ncbi:MAG: transglycosylase SLT domain-containing protein [Sulfuritalea sp.]|nr:transglycosylase SLT domain-containing protein [Sulfuritalea sp.]